MKIPEKEFAKIVENFPMVCVNVVIACEGNVLMAYREEEPERHAWFIPGGRVFKNETLEGAARKRPWRKWVSRL